MDRLSGFDYLRCLAGMAVVAIHTQVLTATDAWWAKVLGMNVVMMAVPLFLLMSLYLFQQQGWPLRQRLTRYAWLYGFWVGIFTLAMGGWAILGGAVQHGRLGGLVAYAMTGGYSPYYYLVALSFLTLVVWCLRQMPTWAVLGCLVASQVATVATWHMGVGAPSPYLVLVPFMPLAFVSLLAARGKITTRWLVVIGLLALVAAVLERHWSVDSAYARASNTGFATVVFLLGLRVRRPAPEPVRLVSDCTLGVYCIHLYFISFFEANVMAATSLWQRAYEWAGVWSWSVISVHGIRRALAYKMV